MTEMEKSCYESKKMFVEKINSAFTEYLHEDHSEPLGGFLDIKYEVYKICTPTGNYIKEYIIMTYKGGAIAARTVTANSLPATLSDIVRLLYGGYYDEVDAYKECIKRAEVGDDVIKLI